MLQLLRTILIASVIPAIGYGAAYLVLNDISGFAGPELAVEACQGAGATSSDLCRRVWRVTLMRDVSVWSAVSAIVALALFFALARIAGADRRLNAAIFPRIAPPLYLFIALLVIAHGVILTYAIYVLQAQFAGQVYWVLVAIFGAGALWGVISILYALFTVNRAHPTGVLAKAIPRDEAPALWRFVDGLAEELDASRPANVVVGLDPTFFATAASVVTPTTPAPLSGETLYLSLPLMRLFTESELRAVVGHELGHFRGEDTDYSLRFAPVYRDLAEAYGSLTDAEGRAVSFAAAPAAALVRFLLETFARNERRISRDREFAADRVGVSVASARDLATSLAKVAVYAPLWGKVRAENLARLSEGRVSKNLSRVYEDGARFDVSHQLIGEIVARVLETRIAHPTDSHPPIAERYAAAGFDPSTLTLDDLTRRGASAAALFPDLEAVEEELTLLEHHAAVASGAAKPPEGAPEEDGLLNAAYLLAATMVTADGHARADEVATAEEIGGRMFPHFDPVSFREYFDQLDALAPFEDVLEILGRALPAEHKQMIYAYLVEIAEADQSIAEEERRLLVRAARSWKVSRRRR